MTPYRAFQLLTLSSIMAFNALHSQRTGGGDLNPGLHTNKASIEHFQDMRIGLSIHWGPSSLGGKEISWSRGKEISKDEYDSFYQSFNPTGFDAAEWVNLAKAGGMQYILLTSKHHDGFSLWPSAVSPYTIAHTPFSRDIVGELSSACQAGELLFGSYYSIIDWYHPDYQPYGHGGPGKLYETDARTPDFERYLAFMKAQLAELVHIYGARIIQFDGEWDPTWNHELGSDLYRYVRELDDTVLVNSRVDVGRYGGQGEGSPWDWTVYAGDYEERERMVDWVGRDSHVFGQSDVSWQAWVTIDQAQWSWNATPRLLTATEIIIDMLKTVGDGGNYLINLGPRPDGTFEPEQEKTIRAFGQWVGQYAAAIYGSRAGFLAKENHYTSTQRGDTLFLFVFPSPDNTLTLPLRRDTILKVEHYGGDPLQLEFNAQGEAVLTLPPADHHGMWVLRLHLSPKQEEIR